MESYKEIWKAIKEKLSWNFVVNFTGRKVKRKAKRLRRNQFSKMPLLMQSCGRLSWKLWKSPVRSTGNNWYITDIFGSLKPSELSELPGLGRSYGNATQTIANDLDRFKIYTIVLIVRIELNSVQAIKVVSVVGVVCDHLGSVSIVPIVWTFFWDDWDDRDDYMETRL